MNFLARNVCYQLTKCQPFRDSTSTCVPSRLRADYQPLIIFHSEGLKVQRRVGRMDDSDKFCTPDSVTKVAAGDFIPRSTISSRLTFSGSRLTASPCLLCRRTLLQGAYYPLSLRPSCPAIMEVGLGSENMGHGCFYINMRLLCRKFDWTLLNLWSNRELDRTNWHN